MSRFRFTIVAVLFFGVITALLMIRATATGTSVVLTPDEVVAKKQDLPRVRVVGRVTDRAAIDYIRDPRLELHFAVTNPGGSHPDAPPLPVVYYGLKPDMFAPGRDVILDGEVRNGTFVASTLLTQCPSKYEPPKPS